MALPLSRVAPVSPRSGVRGPESRPARAQIALDRTRHVLGRHTGCDTVIEHPSTSRAHAAISHNAEGASFVIDLGSAHGTFLNDARLERGAPARLRVGDELRFAASTRIYVFAQRPPPAGQRDAAAAKRPADGDERGGEGRSKAARLEADASAAPRPAMPPPPPRPPPAGT